MAQLNPFEPPHSQADEDEADELESLQGESLPLASRSIRFTNSVVDGLAATLIYFAYVGLVQTSQSAWGGGYDVYVFQFAYYLFFESLWGTTPAKWLTRTRVVTEDGRRPAFFRVVLRTLVRFAPFDALTFLSDPPEGWHDRWSNTRVVRRPRRRSL